MRLAEREVVAAVRRLHLRELRLWVREGWVKPAEADDGPVFDEIDVARIRLICDLRKDLSLSSDAVPTVLSLLDQIHGLRRELRALADAVDRQPADIRKAVLDARNEIGGNGRRQHDV